MRLFACGMHLFARGVHLFAGGVHLFAGGVHFFAGGVHVFAGCVHFFAGGVHLFADDVHYADKAPMRLGLCGSGHYTSSTCANWGRSGTTADTPGAEYARRLRARHRK